MKKSKGTVKNYKYGLTLAAAMFPIALVGLGVLGIGGVGIANVEQSRGLTDDYKATAIYTEEYTRDLKDLYNDFTAGEIDFDELSKEVQRMNSNDYVKEVIARDIEGNEEFQVRLETSKKLDKALYGTIGVTGAGLAGLVVESAILDSQVKKKRRELEENQAANEAENNEELDEKEGN